MPLDVALSGECSDCEFVCSSVAGMVVDDGVSFMNGLKRFWPLPGVYGVVGSCEFCFGGDEPVRSKSINSIQIDYAPNNQVKYLMRIESLTWSLINTHRTKRQSVIVCEVAITDSLY